MADIASISRCERNLSLELGCNIVSATVRVQTWQTSVFTLDSITLVTAWFHFVAEVYLCVFERLFKHLVQFHLFHVRFAFNWWSLVLAFDIYSKVGSKIIFGIFSALPSLFLGWQDLFGFKTLIFSQLICNFLFFLFCPELCQRFWRFRSRWLFELLHVIINTMSALYHILLHLIDILSTSPIFSWNLRSFSRGLTSLFLLNIS